MICRSCGSERRLRAEDITDEIERMLANAGEQAEGMEKFFKTAEARHSVSARLLTQKTIDFLVDIATGDTASASAESTSDQTPQPEIEENTDDSTT